MSRWGLAARLARRELRGGLSGFWIFLACLTLGVGAIATVQSLSGAVMQGLAEDGSEILGGDLVLDTVYTPPTEQQQETARGLSDTTSLTAELRAMAHVASGDNTLVELKAVDGPYPLYGTVVLASGGTLADALARRDGVWGAVAEETLATRLELKVGDRIRLGTADFELRDLIVSEPDRAAGGFALGPRVMVTTDALAGSGLVVPGSLINWDLRLRLPAGTTPEAAKSALEAAYPDAIWRARDRDNAAPSLQRTIDRLTTYLTLTGLTALLVGGVGVGNAARAYLDGRIPTIATLKTLGASAGLILRTYLLQIMVLAGLGTAAGLVIGAVAPILLARLLHGVLPIPLAIGIFPGALLVAALFGLLTALTFALWPLYLARAVPAAALFRDRTAAQLAPEGGGALGAVLPIGLALLALAALAVWTSADRMLALSFVGAAAATVLLFRAAAFLTIRAARRAGRVRVGPMLRLALAALYRPGAPTRQIVLSLGIGLTVLVAIGQVEGAMRREINDTIPAEAPSFFFVDVQGSQKAAFDALIAATPGGRIVDAVPNLRGRITKVNDRPAATAVVDPDYAWINNGDRGVTYATAAPEGARIVEGEWWPADYDGPPLVSIASEVARAYGIGPGDTLTVNVLGRDLVLEVANVREIEWGRLNVNFTLITSPRPLSGAPHTWLETAKVPDAEEPGLQRAVGEAFPNVSTIRLKESIETFNGLMQQVATAVRATAAVTLAAGGLVLAGVIAAGHRRRVYDSVILKVLGGTRRTILSAFLVEYGLLGLVTALIAAVLGTAAAWAVLTWLMRIDFVAIDVASLLGTIALCLAATLSLGFAGTWIALGQKAAPLLRNE